MLWWVFAIVGFVLWISIIRYGTRWDIEHDDLIENSVLINMILWATPIGWCIAAGFVLRFLNEWLTVERAQKYFVGESNWHKKKRLRDTHIQRAKELKVPVE